MIEKLHLKNFTAFQNVEIELSPKINVIIGENGTGKTHLLKAAYSLCSAPVHLNETPDATDRVIGAGVTAKFQDVFGLDEGKVGSLYRQGIPENAAIKADFTFGKKIYLSFSSRSGSLQINSQQDYARYSWRPVFIPTKEILNLVGAIADPKV
ncbi:MAG: AAA family ATPase, partial [Kiritimatiellae bacterium]|nr:AAA family ATPase [Kiritimatiellia bacterium]